MLNAEIAEETSEGEEVNENISVEGTAISVVAICMFSP